MLGGVRVSVRLIAWAAVWTLAPPLPGQQCTDRDGDGFFVEPQCGTVDCNDAAASTYPGAEEICDGIDNNCDHAIDEAAACERYCVAPDLYREVAEGTPGSAPELVWTGNELAVATVSDGDIHLARFDATGRPLGAAVPVTAGALLPSSPGLTWTGSEYGLTWADRRTGSSEIYFRRVSAAGVPTGAEIQLTDLDGDQEQPTIAWSGSEYGIVWSDVRDLHFIRLDPGGSVIDEAIPVTDGFQADLTPRLIWAGQNYALAWQVGGLSSEIMFARVSRTGLLMGTPTEVTDAPGLSVRPTLAWTGSGFGIAWYDYRDGDSRIRMALLGATGLPVRDDFPITEDEAESIGSSIAWTGAEFGLFWRDARDGTEEVYFARIGADGAELCRETRLTRDGAAGFPSAVWTGAEYGVAWESGGVTVGRTGCACIDADEDGTSFCRDCDDDEPAVTTPVPEVCNAIDDDCNGLVDDDALGEDSDGDGVPGVCDNCAATANPGQEDFDDDGIGDLCEVGARLADANGSGRVDGFDLVQLAAAFGSMAGEARYEAALDLNRDGLIDGDDLAVLARSFGRTS